MFLVMWHLVKLNLTRVFHNSQLPSFDVPVSTFKDGQNDNNNNKTKETLSVAEFFQLFISSNFMNVMLLTIKFTKFERHKQREIM